MEEEKERELEIRLSDLWTVFLHCWWVMLLVGVVVTVGVYIFKNATHEDQYTATATTYVMGVPDQNGVSTSIVSISNNLINDFMETARLEVVLEDVIKNTGSYMSAKEFGRMINIVNKNGTRIVNVSVTAKDPATASLLSNALAEQMCTTLNEKFLFGNEYASVVNPSEIPKTPSNPISMLKILLVAMVCAILVYGVYFVLFLLDDKINTPEDVEKYLKLSLLGQIPNKHDTNKRKKYYAYSYENKNQ